MSLDPSILAWTALATAVALSPGPDTLLVAGNAARRGHVAGLRTVAGIVCGGVFYAALCGFGFMSVLIASPTLYLVVKIAGAGYLALIGAQMLIGAVRQKPSPPAGPSSDRFAATFSRKGRRATLAPFRQGLLTNILNPKVAVFYLAALPQFVGHGPDAPLKGVLLIGIHYVIGGAWLSAVAMGAGRAGDAFRASTAMRWLEGVAGVFLLGVAGRLAVERR
jgi:threonine/homoserine/homoserine lactone efflux protein